MTKEERHIAVLNRMLENMNVFDSIKPTEERKRAIKEAIKALDQKSILDKIRAEIENHCGLTKENHCRYCSYCNSVMGVREILEMIDKYRGE